MPIAEHVRAWAGIKALWHPALIAVSTVVAGHDCHRDVGHRKHPEVAGFTAVQDSQRDARLFGRFDGVTV
jgi:hypothetical protein